MEAKKSAFEKIDLDAWLGQAHEDNEPVQKIHRSTMPDSDKVTVVGIFVDDSGSIMDSGLTSDIVSGVNLCIEALRGAKGADFYLDITGFIRNYYSGMLRDYDGGFEKHYNPTYGATPLVTYAVNQYTDLRVRAEQYAAQGIPSTVSYLVLTDGHPNGDIAPESFKAKLRNGDFVVGIGVRREQNDIAAYREVFTNMGIKKILTPKATGSEIRHAVNEFSRSVVSDSIKV